MNGMAGGSPLSQLTDTAYLVASDPAIPMSRPPKKVNGRLEK